MPQHHLQGVFSSTPHSWLGALTWTLPQIWPGKLTSCTVSLELGFA